jgi:hypothetical protein
VIHPERNSCTERAGRAEIEDSLMISLSITREFLARIDWATMDPHRRRLQWTYPIVVLVTFSLLVFAGFYTIDYFITGGADKDSTGPLSRYWHFDADHITDAVSALGGMIAAVLGIVITVVSIIVQLSAARYTGVARMFLRDRINIGVMAFYVMACICGVWLSMSVHADFVPRAALLAVMSFTTLGLVVMAPYFAYVFWFVDPVNIIARIRRGASKAASTGAHMDDDAAAASAQADVLAAMEELTDITSNSISGKDKIIASRAVDALKDFAIEYLEPKKDARPGWFRIQGTIAENPDFVAMDPESLADLEQRRTWIEWKVLRQYMGIYNEALVPMRDITYLIAIDTRYIGEAAGEVKDEELVTLVFRFMNSYMRAALNARDVRTAYNVLNQYRLLVEAMLRQKNGAAALEAVKYMNYYASVSFDAKLTFVTETIAYDVSALCAYAHEMKSPEEVAIFAEMLELDRPTHAKSDRGLLGVRKAQVKLASYYLAAGDEEKARLIAKDMQDETEERLRTIRDQLERVKSKDFWEIIDRGRNFEYMPPNQREQMEKFFGWLKIEPAAHSQKTTAA